MDFRSIGFDPTIVDTIHELLDFSEEADKSSHHAPSRAYIRDAKAMAATPADVKDLPNAFVFMIDMPGVKQEQIKVQVEDNNVLVVSGETRREKEKDEGVKYIRMERRLGKYLKKFQLTGIADTEKVSATNRDGVLTVTAEKKPPPEPKKPKTIQVQIG